jgi:LL-diaminopimelate aminotransferase
MTTPGYPVFGTHAEYLGGQVHNLPLLEKNNFLPDLSAIPTEILRRAKTLVINYPNNPTGASATPRFFADVVEFARQNNLVVIHDAAYAALVFDGKLLSLLATPGAIDVAVELHSMSKAFNMTGWRLGFVAGNPLIIRAYADVKDNTDSGQFLAIQEACAFALDHPEMTRQIAAKYSRRMDGLVSVLNQRGLSARKPNGSFFLYVRSPRSAVGRDGKRTPFANAEAFSQWLIAQKLISTVPWDDAGAYVRFSVTFAAADEAQERRVLAEIDNRLAGCAFEF